MATAPRKFDTAPARMRSKREVAATWDIHQATEFFAPPSSTQVAAAAADACMPHVASRAATLSGKPTYAAGSSADWNAHGSGSWGRISKRRTSQENAMSLWEVSEALKTAAEPAVAAATAPTLELHASPFDALLRDDDDNAAASKSEDVGMGLLDTLVALEAAGQHDGGNGDASGAVTPTSETECADGDEPIRDPDELLAMLHPDTGMLEAPAMPMSPLSPSADANVAEPTAWGATLSTWGGDEAPASAPAGCDTFDGLASLMADGPASPSPTSVW